MSLAQPIRYVNNGEPLNQTVLNRAIVDIQINLEDLFNRVDGYDNGVAEANSLRVVRRDAAGTAKFGTPTQDQHPIRLVEFEDFKTFLLDSNDVVRNERLPKASTTLEGIVQLVDSFTDTSITMAPTADALRRGLEDQQTYTDDAIDGLPYLTEAEIDTKIGDSTVTLAQSIAENSSVTNEATTPKAVADFVEAQLGGLDTGGVDLINSIFSGDTRTTGATTPKAVWDAISEFAGSGDEPIEPAVNGDSFSNGTSGWLQFPNGFIIQWGSGVSSGSGITDVSLPISVSNKNYAFVATEEEGSGWDFAEGAKPTIYEIGRASCRERV